MEIRKDQRPEVDLVLPRDLDGFFHGSKDYVTTVSFLRQVRLNEETRREGVSGKREAAGKRQSAEGRPGTGKEDGVVIPQPIFRSPFELSPFSSRHLSSCVLPSVIDAVIDSALHSVLNAVLHSVLPILPPSVT
jgi:hypothetical protein